MRLRIVHQLSLLLTGIALLGAAAIGGWFAWNLKAGFSDYLRSRDAQQLVRFAEVVQQRVDWRSGADGVPHVPMRELMDEFMHREGLAPPPDWRPPPRPQGARPRPPRHEGEPPPDGERPPPREGRAEPPPRRGPPQGVGARIQVVGTDGNHLGGPRFAEGQQVLTHPVRADGQVVAYVRMVPSTELQDVDARFLQRQYTGLAVALGVTMLLGLLAASLAARWLAAPLQGVQAATRRIAGGELGVTLPETGSREMADLIQDVNSMSTSLQQLEGARRQWIAQISHELRTPLSVLLGELESMQDGARETTPEMLALLRGEVLQLVRLVADLHTLSMADLGALPCTFGDGHAGEFLHRLVQRHAPRLAQAGIALELRDGGNPLVRWDFGRIEQLVTNLVENSLRYTRAPGRLRVQWTVQAGVLQLVVEDSPPGVDAAQMAQLFEPLFRADTARQRQSAADHGSGLGLAICKAIVKAHGGRIAAHASPLGGLGITVALPLNPEEAR
jgi:two-component system sensor histidine kinase BaeS